VVQVDVVGRCGTHFQSYRFAHHKGDGLGLCLPHNLRRGGATLGLVQHLMCQLMHERGEGFGLRLTGQDGDTSAVAHAERGRNVLGKDKLDALTLNERKQTVVVFAHVAIDLAHCGKIDSIGLPHVEDIGIAEANKDAGILLGNVFLGFLLGLALDADDGSQNADAFFALLHAAA
jgi:hypothetical protein